MEFMRTLTRPRPLVAGPSAAGSFVYSGMALAIGLLVLFALNVGLHFPGSQNEDSLQQYQQALTGEYQDWHPPVMAWLWAQLLRLAPGPAPMLLLQLAAYWLGFGLLADGLRRIGQPRLAWVVALIGAFPPFLALNALIVKDVGLVAAWVAAIGIVFWFRVQSRPLPLWAGVIAGLLLLYGTLVRTNAIFGLGPLLLLLAWPHRLQWKALMVAAVVTAPLMLPVSQFFNRDVLGARNNEAVQSLFLFDLLGIARHTGQPGLLEPRATMSQQDVQACYTPYWWDSLAPWGRCGGKVHKAADPKVITSPEGLSRQWLSAIAANPVAYAQHRLKHFNSALMFAVPLKHVRLVPEYQPADASSFKPFGVISAQEVRWDLLRKSPIVWPVSWMAWGVVLLVFLARRREDTGMTAGTARVLTVSALGYATAYLLVGVSTDVRYHYWAMLALLEATVLALPQLAQGWRDRDRSLRIGLAGVATVILAGTAARLLDFQAFM